MKVFSTSLGSIFLIIISLLAFLGKLPVVIIGLYIVVSLISFGLYWKDKRAARNNTWRIPENTLHLVALCCGWPGSLIGQQQLRHKTQKVSFRVLLWLTIIGNLVLLFGFLFVTHSLPFINQ